ncbi:MAG: hypothetical protein IJV54_09260 [Bacteroidales bacterium]|nr:hypothetical protein [Bacteroidales bacterium]MBQ9712458.1 hypothetical protein [Bacteroidales bacterium]MBR1436372.1 hypothetical protein [Bacteroidales bacterium]
MSDAESKGLLQIAQVLKSNGTEGEIVMGFRDFVPEDIDLQEPVFIYFDGLPVPFFIESFAKKGSSKAIVRLTGMRNLEDAEEVVGRPVYGEDDIYGYEEEESLEGLVGWTLLDEDGTKAGEVTDFEDIPGNPCIYVETASGQAMIPLHEDLILEMDEKKRSIRMRIPEGLV